VTPEEHLDRLMRGERRGLTRAELAYRLRIPDRAVRQLIEDSVASGKLPIVADRTNGGEARYRLAGRDEIDLINAEHHELLSRALSLHRRAKGLLVAWEHTHNTGNLFTPVTPEMTR
jgi:predicted ArsR family transcriptional regulator